MVHNASKGLRGVGLSGVTLDKDGNLIFTMSDGTVQTIKGYSQDLVNTTNEINNIKEEVSTMANNAADSAKEAKETADSIKQEYNRVEGATNSGLALIERSVLYGINRVKEATKTCKSDALANIELAHKDAIDDIAIRRLEALQDISETLGGQLAYFDEVSVDNDTLTFRRGSGDTHKLTIDYVQHAYKDASDNIITDTYATKQELNTEASARKSADDDEATARRSADKTLQNSKQDKLTFDTTPTANSSNPVTSGGVKTYVDDTKNTLNTAISKKADSTDIVQADWNVTDTTSKAFIKNKPDVLLKSGGTATGSIVAPSFQTGSDASHYFQCQKFRGEGNANTYYHAIDFGYGGHNQVDFYEYGGLWNFYKSTDGNKAGLVGAIQAGQGWNGLVKGQDITSYAKKSDLASSLSTKALTVTGETSVPTANEGNSSKAIANTEFVQKTVANLVNSAPDTLNTLGELAQALGDDPNFATTMATELGKKANTADVANTYLDKLTTTVQKVTAPIQHTGTPSSNDELVNKSYVDSTVQGELTNYLPLSGGTMTGSIQYVNNGKVFAIGNTVAGNVDLGWNWDNSEGAGLGLRSTDASNPGEFSLYARDANNSCYLSGKPGGSLTWNDKEIERVSAKGTYGIRFESGIQICWGELIIPAGTSGRDVSGTMTFPYPFANNQYALTFGNNWCGSSSEYYRAEDIRTGNFKFTARGVSDNSHKAFYIAIGYWK